MAWSHRYLLLLSFGEVRKSVYYGGFFLLFDEQNATLQLFRHGATCFFSIWHWQFHSVCLHQNESVVILAKRKGTYGMPVTRLWLDAKSHLYMDIKFTCVFPISLFLVLASCNIISWTFHLCQLIIQPHLSWQSIWPVQCCPVSSFFLVTSVC